MPAVLASATAVSNNGPVVATRPPGTADGEHLVAVVFSDPDDPGFVIGPPAGWAISGSPGTGPGGVRCWVYTKVASAEPASWTWTLSSGTSNAVHTLRITGAAGVEVVPSFGGSTSSTTSHVANSISPSPADALLICAMCAVYAGTGVATHTAPSGMVEQTDLGPSDFSPGYQYSSVATQQLGAAGATGTKTFVSSIPSVGGSGGSVTVSLAVQSAAAPPGGPTPLLGSVVLEVETVAGSDNWVNLSDRVQSVDVERPRPTLDDPAPITRLTAVIGNYPDKVTGISPLTPDNPLGPHWPHVAKRDRRVRLRVTYGPTTWTRFLGWSDRLVPNAGAGSPADETVTLTASCILSRYGRRKLLSDYGRRSITLGAGPNEYWPYDDGGSSTVLRGLDGAGLIDPAEVILPVGATGSMALEQPDDTIIVDGVAVFARGDSAAPSPVILHKTRPGAVVGRVSAWFRLDQDPALANDDAISAWRGGDLVWRLVATLSAGTIRWQVVDANGGVRAQWDSGFPRDDAWRWVSVLFFDTGGGVPGSVLAIRDRVIPDRIVGSFIPSWPDDPRNITHLVVGGRMAPNRRGKQVNTLQGAVSGLAIQYAELQSSPSFYSAAGELFTASSRAILLNGYGSDLDAIVGGGLGHSDTDPTLVQLTGAAGRYLLDMWAEHVVTTGGVLLTRTDGPRQWVRAAGSRTATVAATLDVEADLHLPAGEWRLEHDQRPTRVEATSPAGTATAVDAATEAETGMELDGPTVETAGGTVDVARQAAAWVLAKTAARPASFALDLTLTQTDKVAAVMDLQPGQRIRLTGIATGVHGISYMDCYASGWTERYLPHLQGAEFAFDCDAADDPPEGTVGDAEYGRVGADGSTVTGGTAVGTTGVGTIVVTSTGATWSTAAGDYPLDADWHGERVTIPSPPAGSTSPQTLTIGTRGVAPTVARAHAAGEPIDIWHSATATR